MRSLYILSKEESSYAGATLEFQFIGLRTLFWKFMGLAEPIGPTVSTMYTEMKNVFQNKF